jgi:hypothetical protein
VLTLNQVFVALSSSFIGSPIHPPLGALTWSRVPVGSNLEREMCPWAISKYFGDWVPTQVLKRKSMPIDGQSTNQV